MNMPGFTAEKSVYKTGDHYRMLGNPASLAGREVIPQFCRTYEGGATVCIQCVYVRGFGSVCWSNVYRTLPQ